TFGMDNVKIFGNIFHESLLACRRRGVLWIKQRLHVLLYPAELRISIGLHLRDIRALLAEELYELGLSCQRHVCGQRRKHDDSVNLVRLFRWKIVRPVKKGAHRKQAAFAMSNDRDALIILLEVGQRAIE